VIRPFATVRPDTTVVVREHATGADIVEVTLLDPQYPSGLLKAQLDALGTHLGSPPRGLEVFLYQVDPAKSELTFLKARFAVDGLIDRQAQVLRIEPLLKALALRADGHAVRGISLIFQGERPTANTIRRFESQAVLAEARAIDDPPAIEYRIQLRADSPEEISFPERRMEQPAAPKASTIRKNDSTLIIGAIIAAGVASGALVYLALLQGRRRAG
jgi:hypothetical protein